MTNLPLRGKSVVVTRAQADAGELTAQLEAAGAAVTLVPSIVLKTRPVDEAMRAAVRDLPRTAWIAFASRQGVLSFSQLLKTLAALLPANVRLAAVGPGTAKSCVETFARDAALVAEPCNAEGLAQALITHAKPADGAVLLPAAAAGRVALRELLTQAGFDVRHLIMYDTKPATAADGPVRLPVQVDYVLFTSPSTVEGFLARSHVPNGARVVTIGPTTSAAVRTRGLHVAHEAREHTLEGLVRILTEASRHAH